MSGSESEGSYDPYESDMEEIRRSNAEFEEYKKNEKKRRLKQLRKAATARGLTLPSKLSPLMQQYVDTYLINFYLTADQIMDLVVERNFLDANAKAAYEEVKNLFSIDPKNEEKLKFAKKYAMMAFKLAGGDVKTAPPGLQKLLT